MRFELKQLNNHIFVLSFDDEFTMSMCFLRWSEYTECSDPKINGKIFTILDFVESYTRDRGTFSYTSDWSGFNIPSRRFEQYPFGYIKDRNKYDDFMESVVTFIKSAIGSQEPFYLIGHLTGATSVVDHETAHAMYDRMPAYKQEIQELILTVFSDKKSDEILSCIAEMGYSKEVLEDEMQAYLSTGLSEELEKLGLKKKKLQQFVDVFEKYKGILINGD